MTVRSTAACLLVLSLLAPRMAASQAGDPLEQAVAAAIQACTHLTIFDDVIGRADNGTVVLDGKVTTASKKADLGQRVSGLAGVHTVRNHIVVLPSSRTDDELRYRVARAIYGSPRFWSYAAMPRPPIHIIVEDGHVTLAGIVSSHTERAVARSLASGKGERSLTDRLRTAARSSPR